ncbi:MAG: macro domain-containing protein [Anaerolineae bacterium]|nr:macro domain-containing protein [Anaerolineae bacterium]
MKLILVDINPALCLAWENAFKDLPDVEIHMGYFESIPEFDCMVSPANSFGLMDGGIDAAITRFFGVELMYAVQKRIIEDYLGEQPVGTSMIVRTPSDKHPFLAHTPTMRVPLTISHTDHVYLAMWAMLRAVHQHNQRNERQINIVACPGLGTGVGRVPFREAARQMSLAYKNYLKPPTHINWGFASERQLQVRFGGDDGYIIPPEN